MDGQLGPPLHLRDGMMQELFHQEQHNRDMFRIVGSDEKDYIRWNVVAFTVRT